MLLTSELYILYTTQTLISQSTVNLFQQMLIYKVQDNTDVCIDFILNLLEAEVHRPELLILLQFKRGFLVQSVFCHFAYARRYVVDELDTQG